MDNITLIIPRYLRKGKCNRCGWCCEYKGCNYIDYDGDKAICTIYENRPPECVVFPEAPPILHEGCGFYYLDRWENDKKVKYGNDL